MSWEAGADGSGAWVPATHMGDVEQASVLGFGLAQPQLLQVFEE